MKDLTFEQKENAKKAREYLLEEYGPREDIKAQSNHDDWMDIWACLNYLEGAIKWADEGAYQFATDASVTFDADIYEMLSGENYFKSRYFLK